MKYGSIIEKIGTTFLLTVVAYFAAYVFEVAYLRSFNISWQAARVTIPSLAVSFVAIMMLILVYILPISRVLIDIFHETQSKSRRFIYKRLLECAVGSVLAVFAAVFLPGRISAFWLAIGVLIAPGLAVISWFIFDFLPLRNISRGALVQSMVSFESRDSELSAFEKQRAVRVYAFIMITTLAVFVPAYLAGYWTAREVGLSRSFFFDGHQYVVVRDYDGVIVAKELLGDRTGERYLYINSSENKLLFHPTHINSRPT